MTKALADLLGPAAAIIGRELSRPEITLIGKYLEILREWNRVQRLVGRGDTKSLVDNIVLDSLLFLKVLPASTSRVLDVGSGAGVPGIPLKILKPAIDLVMVDARRKRVSFLSAAIRTLGFEGARAVHTRIEDVETCELGGFDAIVARCTAGPMRLFGAVEQLLSANGVVVVAGPPVGGVHGPNLRWMSVRNPVTGRTRNFAIMRSTWNTQEQN